MAQKSYDVIIIGSGPGGYVAAIRAAQLGLKTAIIEKDYLGGTCLNVGCIPTKTLFQSAEIADAVNESAKYGVNSSFEGLDFAAVMRRKDKVVRQLSGGVRFLLKKNGIDVIMGEATLLSPTTVKDLKSGEVFETKNVLIAAGSSNAAPPIPGIDGGQIIDSTGLLALTEMPASLAIIGGGVIGCEFAGIFNSFGCSVTILEMLPQLLGNMDTALAKAAVDQFASEGIRVELGARVREISDRNGRKLVVFEKDGTEDEVEAEYVLVSAGRKANIGELGLDRLGIETENGFIQVDSHMRSSIPGIYACGDITGEGMLAHTASEGGTVAVENMAGIDRELDLKAVPKVVFINKEIASAGVTEEEAGKSGRKVLCGMFSLIGNGKSLAMGKNDGFVKVIADGETHAVIGLHMAGPCASELITLGTQLITSEVTLEDVTKTIYPHPAVAEAIREACMDALGRCIHA